MPRPSRKRTLPEWLKGLLILLFPVLGAMLGLLLKPLDLGWQQVLALFGIVFISLAYSLLAFVYYTGLDDGVYDLAELTKTLERIRHQIPPELFVVEDYASFLAGKCFGSVWVMGVELEHTVGQRGTQLLLNRLREGCHYRFLCCGSHDDIVVRARHIARAVHDADPTYLGNGAVTVRWLPASHHVQLASTIYNATHGCDIPTEVLIALDQEVETGLKPAPGIFMRGEVAVQQYLEKFELLWSDTHTQNIPLASLAAEAD